MNVHPVTHEVRFARQFQLWAYSVGHAQLLLLSPKPSDTTNRIEVLFKNVAWVNLPTVMQELIIREVSEGEAPAMLEKVDRNALKNRKIFLVQSLSSKGFVIAGICAWGEDSKEYFEPSTLLQIPHSSKGDSPSPEVG